MRSVRYTVKPARVEGGRLALFEVYERERPLADLIFGELHDNWFMLVPPLEVLNRELMGGGAVVPGPEPNQRQYFFNWIPFEVTQEEYLELVEAAARLPGRPFEYVEPPKDVRLPDEWGHWALVRSMSRPKVE